MVVLKHAGAHLSWNEKCLWTNYILPLVMSHYLSLAQLFPVRLLYFLLFSFCCRCFVCGQSRVASCWMMECSSCYWLFLLLPLPNVSIHKLCLYTASFIGKNCFGTYLIAMWIKLTGYIFSNLGCHPGRRRSSNTGEFILHLWSHELLRLGH